MIWVSVAAVVIAGILISVSIWARSPERTTLDYDRYEESIERNGAITLVVGNPDAPVILTDYSDFGCSHCADLSRTITRIITEYVAEQKVKLAFKPISFVAPPYSDAAAAAAICAAEQGRFLEMHDELWEIHDGAAGLRGFTETNLISRAQAMGLDVSTFTACMQSPDTKMALDEVEQEALSRGINGTPAMFVNDQQVLYRGADLVYGDLVAAIEAALGG